MLNCCVCFSFMYNERVSEIYKRRKGRHINLGVCFMIEGKVIPPATTECPIQSDLVDSIVFSSKTVAKHGFLTLGLIFVHI